MPEITTAAELEALHMAVGEAARAACVEDRYGDPWLIVENDGGDLIAWSYPYEDYPDIHNWKSAESLEMPLTVLYRPDRPAQPTVLPTVEALALHLQEYWARSARRREPIIWADLARDTLALIGEPTALPDLETLALVAHQGWQGYACTCGLDDLGPVEREAVTRVARAVLDAIRGER